MVNFISSPATLPLHRSLTSRSLSPRTTTKEIVFPLTLPSVISAEPRPLTTVPVSLLRSTSNSYVEARMAPSWVLNSDRLFPRTSAAGSGCATRTDRAVTLKNVNLTVVFPGRQPLATRAVPAPCLAPTRSRPRPSPCEPRGPRQLHPPCGRPQAARRADHLGDAGKAGLGQRGAVRERRQPRNRRVRRPAGARLAGSGDPAARHSPRLHRRLLGSGRDRRVSRLGSGDPRCGAHEQRPQPRRAGGFLRFRHGLEGTLPVGQPAARPYEFRGQAGVSRGDR